MYSTIQCWARGWTAAKIASAQQPVMVNPALSQTLCCSSTPEYSYFTILTNSTLTFQERCDWLMGWGPPILLLCPHAAAKIKIAITYAHVHMHCCLSRHTFRYDALTTGADEPFVAALIQRMRGKCAAHSVLYFTFDLNILVLCRRLTPRPWLLGGLQLGGVVVVVDGVLF